MKKKKIVLFGVVLPVILLVSVLLFAEYNNVYRECFVEAGVNVSPTDFFKKTTGAIAYAEESDVIDTKVPGEYHVVLKKGMFQHKSTLFVSDTIAPQGQVKNVILGSGERCGAEAFVSNIVDATAVTVTYKEEPDFSQMGKQQVEVVLKDLGQNETIITAELVVAPVLSEVLVEAGSEAPAISEFVIEGVNGEFVIPYRQKWQSPLKSKEIHMIPLCVLWIP